MDIFKQNRNLMIVVIILVILNITTLTFLWLGKPKNPSPREFVRNKIEEPKRIKTLLKNELGFDEQQSEEYLKLRKDHRRKIDKLNFAIRKIKKQMFDEAFKEGSNVAISDSLLNLAQTKQAEIESLTFQHFVKLKNLCRPNQKNKLQLLIHEFFQPAPEGQTPQPPPPGLRK